MARRRGVVRLEAPSPRTALAVGGVGLAGVLAVALTFSGPKTPPEYVSPVAAGSVAPTRSAGVESQEPAQLNGFGSVAVVLGDGLSVAPSKPQAFPCAAAVGRGWRCVSFAAAGSGYATAGDAGRYADQLARAAKVDDVGLVVISGGGVDRAATADRARSAAEALVAAARFAFPGATIVLVPPFDTGSGGSAALTAVRRALRASANGDDVLFADGAAWLRGRGAVLGPDGRSLSAAAAGAARDGLAQVLPAPSDAATSEGAPSEAAPSTAPPTTTNSG